MKKTILLLTLFSAFTHAGVDANTSSSKISGVYLGGGFGTTNFEDDGAFGADNIDDGDSTFKLIGGYQFNRIVAIELQYSKYGDIKNNSYFANSWDVKSAKHTSISLAANVGYTFDSGWRPFAIAGLGSIEQKLASDNMSDSDTGTSFRYGAGVEYAPKALNGLAFRVAYEGDLFVVDSGTTNNFDDYTMTIGSFYAGATYKF